MVVTEAGFGADLGAEKFFDIVCRSDGFRPNCAVLVCSIKALKMHGGCPLKAVGCEDPDALRKGFSNLDKHIENIRHFGVPRRGHQPLPADTEEEVRMVREHCQQLGVRCALSEVFAKGGAGGQELADQVAEAIEKDDCDFRYLYGTDLPLKEKIRIIATQMYGAQVIEYETAAQRHLRVIEESGQGNLMVCMAKTHCP